jgi:hypothetical protein
VKGTASQALDRNLPHRPIKTAKVKARDEEIRGVLVQVRRRTDEECNAEIRRFHRPLHRPTNFRRWEARSMSLVAYPISLSYHASTFTNVPSITVVDNASTVPDSVVEM